MEQGRRISVKSARSSLSVSAMFAQRKLEDISTKERLRELDAMEEMPDFDLLYSTDQSFHELSHDIHGSIPSESIENIRHRDVENLKLKGYLDDFSRFDLISSSVMIPKSNFRCKIVGSAYGYVEFSKIIELDVFLKSEMQKRSITSLRDLPPFWIDFQATNAIEMSLIELIFGLHPLTTRECIATETREKLEIMDKYTFIIIHEISPSDPNMWMNLIPLRFLLFQNFILTFHPTSLPCVTDAIYMAESNGTIHTPDRCLYMILRNSVMEFEKRVGATIFEVQTLDELALVLFSSSSETADLLRRIQAANTKLSSLFWLMSVKQQIFLSLCTINAIGLNRTTQLYFRALLDSTVKMRLGLEIGRENLDNSHSNYLALASVKNAQSSDETNILIKRLTSISTIILPLTLIAGLFGMNVHVPGETVSNLNWFWGICSFMAIVVILLGSHFHKRGLL